MAILTEYSLWLTIPCLVAGCLYSLLLYYKNKTIDFDKKSLIAMSTMRGIAMFLLLFLLLSPITKTVKKQSHKPVLVFAIDNSESIVYSSDSLYYRTTFQKDIAKMIAELNDKYKVETVLIGDENIFINNTENFKINFDNKKTDISSVFTNVKQLYANQNVGALLLFTDAIYNKGSNPVHTTDNIPFPVYTVGLGDTIQQKDLKIVTVNHNSQTFTKNNFPVEIKVAAFFLQGKCSNLTVTEDNQILFAKNINITSNKYLETVSLNLTAGEKGMHHYTVKLEELEDEISYRNNTFSFYVEVIDTKEKIAIIYNAPHPDIAAIKDAISVSEKYNIESYDINDFKENPESYSLIIFHQLPSSQQNSNILVNNILNKKIPSLFIIGEKTDIVAFNKLNAGLSIKPIKTNIEKPVPEFNSNFNSFIFSEEAKNSLKYFPPLTVIYGEYTVSIASNIFLYQKINSVLTNYPLFIFSTNNNIKIGVICGTGIWQWKIYNYVNANNFDAFDEIISKTVQYLSINSDRSNFKVLSKSLFDETEDVMFQAELYNDSYELVTEPDINLKLIEKQTGFTSEYLFSKQLNNYTLNLGQLKQGSYLWHAETKYGTKSYSRDGKLEVRDIMIESVNLLADFELLKSLSFATNGKFYTRDDMHNMVSDIKNNNNIKTIISYNKTYSTILNSTLYFIIIIILFGIEWFLRKWNGGY